jgi:hypothetical protein
MREHELDQVLSEERNVTPSAKFTKSVMNAVQLEAVALPPITFPWVRALPGLAAGLFASMWIIIEGFRLYDPQRTTFVPGPWIERIMPLVARAEHSGVAWVLLALAVTAVCVELTWRASERRV